MSQGAHTSHAHTYMDNLFKTLTEYNDKATRIVILTLLFHTNEKFQQFVADMLVIITASLGKIINPEGLPILYTNIICNIAITPQNYHNVYNDYLNRGRIAIMEDFVRQENKRKAV